MFTGSKRVLLLSAAILLLTFGCAGLPRQTASPPETAPSSDSAAEPRATVPIPEQPGNSGQPAPRTLASLQLTEQARLLIASRKPDEAIRTLERALNIDPGNGRNYYFLAEAWIMKGNSAQAIEFNRMAAIYLDRDADWMPKVREQKARIEKIGKTQ